MKVGFFIVGAPKAGTTSLYHYLSAHPNVTMSKKKETNYFSDQEIFQNKLYYGKSRVDSLAKYEKLFPVLNADQIYGEASVSYLFYKEVPNRIKEYNSEAKIIIMLRDPVERAFSHYLMDYKLGLISESFESVFIKKSGIFFQQYFDLGNYTNQIKRYFDIFEISNIHIIWHSDFKSNSKIEMQKVYKFLDLDNFFAFDMKTIHNPFSLPKNILIRKMYSMVWLRRAAAFLFPKKLVLSIKKMLFNKDKKPELSEKLRKEIIQYYLSDIVDLEELLNKNLESWKK